MSNRPGLLCQLQTNKSIGAQKSFAATFNWLVSCMKNLKGGKHIQVNWPADDTPEIECINNDKVGGGGGTISNGNFHFPLELKEGEEEEGKIQGHVGFGLIQAGGRTLAIEGKDLDIDDNCWIAVKLVTRLTDDEVDKQYTDIVTYEDLESLQAEQNNMEKFIVPLYQIVDGKVGMDFRCIPQTGYWEPEV